MGLQETASAWTPEEDARLMELISVYRHGSHPKWTHIAKKLSEEALINGGKGRTAAMVRNRHLRIEQGKAKVKDGKCRNRCGQCGEYKLGHICTMAAPQIEQKPRSAVQTVPTLPSALPKPSVDIAHSARSPYTVLAVLSDPPNVFGCTHLSKVPEPDCVLPPPVLTPSVSLTPSLNGLLNVGLPTLSRESSLVQPSGC